MKTKYILKHPNKRISVDKVGSNTSQAKDGQKGVRKCYVLEQRQDHNNEGCAFYSLWIYSCQRNSSDVFYNIRCQRA